MIPWLDELRLDPGPPFQAMGTHALHLNDWLIVDDKRAADLARKVELLTTARPVVFAAQDAAAQASTELLAIVQNWLGERGVDVAEPMPQEHPLIRAALMVQEDLAVLQYIEGAWILTAGVVCFPTHWTIADKVGLPLEGVHAPVAHYEAELREKVDRFHDRLMVNHPVWRRNWFVNATDELHQPESGGGIYLPGQQAPVIQPDGSPMWIRSERQTLRRLPASDAIVFTIRVQHAPLGVLRERPDLAAKMLATTQSWDVPKRLYTSTGVTLDALNEWLASVADPEA